MLLQLISDAVPVHTQGCGSLTHWGVVVSHTRPLPPLRKRGKGLTSKSKGVEGLALMFQLTDQIRLPIFVRMVKMGSAHEYIAGHLYLLISSPCGFDSLNKETQLLLLMNCAC